jgi:hypothetical protein
MIRADLLGLHTLEAFGTYEEGTDASDWIVNDIQIGNRSQFVQAEDIPGDMFSTNDTVVAFEPVQTAMDLTLTVTNIGTKPAEFQGNFLGTDAASWARMLMPMRSTTVPPNHTAQITSRPQRAAFRPERLMIAGAKENHVLLSLGGVLYDFSSTGSVAKIEDAARTDELHERMTPIQAAEPDLLFLRLHGDTLLYGVSERSGLVVFEAGTTSTIEDDYPDDDVFDEDDYFAVYGPPKARAVTKHFLRFDLEGFTPEWWPMPAEALLAP